MRLTVWDRTDSRVLQGALGLAFAIQAVVGAVLVLVGIYRLFQVARTLSAGEPFVPRNPLRLFGIAGLLAVGTMLDGLV